MKKHYFVVVLLWSLCLFDMHAQQGNYKFNNFGNRSILLVGNVTGSVTDIGLAYYNPSFLVNSEDVGISLNAKAYQLESIKLDKIVNDNSKLSSSRFHNASTMAGGIFNLFNNRFAYSYLTKTNHNTDLNYSSFYLNDNILELFPDAETHKANIRIKSSVKDDWTGISWAHKLTERLSLGISTFASFYSYKGNSNLNHTVQSADNSVAYFESATRFTQKSYGLFVKIGGNYQFDTFSLGLNVNLPYIEIYSDGSFFYSKVVSGLTSENDIFADNELKDLKAKRQEPIGISIGAGIPINRSKLHLNIDYVSGFGRYNRLVIPDINIGNGEISPVNFDEERNAVFNFGFGVELFLKENLMGYGGFSTDFSSLNKSANIIDLAAEGNKDINFGENFYHYSLGIDWSLKWGNIIVGMTYTNSSSEFLSPYRLNTDGIDITNELNSELKYKRWQFVIGLDITLFGKKLSNL